MISLHQQIEEIDYELDQRSKVYPRIAAKDPRRRSELDYHVERMKAVRATLVALQTANIAGRHIEDQDPDC